jgi:hypothetical protein
MGKYIEKLPDGTELPKHGKVHALLTIEGAKIINQPIEWEEDIVCVVDNYTWDAAAYAFDDIELRRFSHPRDDRFRVWLKIPNAKNLAE